MADQMANRRQEKEDDDSDPVCLFSDDSINEDAAQLFKEASGGHSSPESTTTISVPDPHSPSLASSTRRITASEQKPSGLVSLSTPTTSKANASTSADML